jgi:hypothetical protein
MTIRVIYLPTAELACTLFPGTMEEVKKAFNQENQIFYRANYDGNIVSTINDFPGFKPIPKESCIPKHLLEIIEVDDV